MILHRSKTSQNDPKSKGYLPVGYKWLIISGWKIKMTPYLWLKPNCSHQRAVPTLQEGPAPVWTKIFRLAANTTYVGYLRLDKERVGSSFFSFSLNRDSKSKEDGTETKILLIMFLISTWLYPSLCFFIFIFLFCFSFLSVGMMLRLMINTKSQQC